MTTTYGYYYEEGSGVVMLQPWEPSEGPLRHYHLYVCQECSTAASKAWA